MENSPNNKTRKKVFVKDGSTWMSDSEDIKIVLEDLASEHYNLILDVDVVEHKRVIKSIPRGYDGYIIHLSEIYDEDEIVNLKEEQPWSIIYPSTGAREDLETKLKKSIDNLVYTWNRNRERYLNFIKELKCKL